jgi:hypothetical protein
MTAEVKKFLRRGPTKTGPPSLSAREIGRPVKPGNVEEGRIGLGSPVAMSRGFPGAADRDRIANERRSPRLAWRRG